MRRSSSSLLPFDGLQARHRCLTDHRPGCEVKRPPQSCSTPARSWSSAGDCGTPEQDGCERTTFNGRSTGWLPDSNTAGWPVSRATPGCAGAAPRPAAHRRRCSWAARSSGTTPRNMFSPTPCRSYLLVQNGLALRRTLNEKRPVKGERLRRGAPGPLTAGSTDDYAGPTALRQFSEHWAPRPFLMTPHRGRQRPRRHHLRTEGRGASRGRQVRSPR